MNTDADFAEFARTHGLLPLENDAALDAYEDATDAFQCGGPRTVLLRALIALGIPADIVRWHAAYPGNRMKAVVGYVA